MFQPWVRQLIELFKLSDKTSQCLGGMALACLATLSAVGLFLLTGSNRGLASILAIVTMASATVLGWRAGLTAALVSTVVQDLFFMGDKPLTLFLDSQPQYFLIYLGFFAAGLLPARDLAALNPADQPQPISGSDFVSESVKGEADAEKLLTDAALHNETWRVTAALQNIARSGSWGGYEAGFVHAIARQALNRDQVETTALLAPANDDPNRVNADAGIVTTNSNVVRLPVGREQIPLYVNSKD